MEHLHSILIEEFMSRDVLTLHLNDSVATAYDIMKDHRIRHLPVIDDNHILVGVFTDTDLNHACPPRETSTGWYYDRGSLSLLNLRHFMNTEPSCLFPTSTLKEAAEIMVRNKFGCIPIISRVDRTLVGIVTYIDVLNKIVSFF
jgi:acetoin utilization protein AcuB